MSTALQALRTHSQYAPSVVGVRESPARDGIPGPWPDLHPDVLAAAAKLGITELYQHQSTAIIHALGGRPVAVATGTASGKSLCYLLPVLDAALRDPGATSLLMFPTKALAHDQLEALHAWDALLDGRLAPAAYDGDTPANARKAIRDRSRIVVTNPDMLHAGILPHHPRWDRFLSGLTFCVIDEMHVYRGVFGSHVSNVLRRLNRVARHYGASPCPILASATIANPGELGRLLTGRSVHVIDQDASPRGRRTLVFFNPPIVDDTLNMRRSVILEADRLARLFLDHGTQTIVFARSRQSTELIARYISEGLSRNGAALSPGSVRGYRGGYTATERREIEAGLRSGDIRCVAATNALEVGIDIGQLDACVMAGYPGTIASTWQQAGRAGRRAAHSVAVLVAGNNPLDQYVIRHPEYFFNRSPEHARIDPDNLLILLDHVRCAAFELPFDGREAELPFGGAPPDAPAIADDSADAMETLENSGEADRTRTKPPVADLLAVLEAQGVVKRVGERWFWMADAYPAEDVSLRSAGIGEITIVVSRGEDEDVLGTVDVGAAGVTVHPGAVYLHDGLPYDVRRLDLDSGRAWVEPTDGALYTRASSTSAFRPLRLDADRPLEHAHLYVGELEVRTRATGYRRIRFLTHETVGWGEIDLPEHVHVAGGYWSTLTPGATATLERSGALVIDRTGDRGPDWQAIRDKVRARDGYRCTSCNAPERPGRQHDIHHIVPYREFRTADSGVRQEANSLANLATLCRPCHAAAERAIGFRTALSAAAHSMAHVASLRLMCDPRDLGVSAESTPDWIDGPTVAIYERAAAGVGFGPALFDLHEEIVEAALGLVRECPCPAGCPGCVGPAEDDQTLKQSALEVLRSLG